MIGGRKVLVTGCNGLLGAWLCEALIQSGAAVVGLDREQRAGSRIRELTGKIDLVSGDIADFELVLRVLNEFDIEFIYHLAAQAVVGPAARNPLSTFRSNIQGTWNILEAARTLRSNSPLLQGIIVASSDKAYGDQDNLPYREDAPMQGRFPYDVSKSCADLIARSYYYSYNLPVCVTRCGNLYGAGDLNWSRIVPGTIMHVLRGERPIIRSDGTPVRDYLYVKDAVGAFLKLSERMFEDSSTHGEAFNISNETPVSVLEIVQEILELLARTDLKPIIEARSSLEIGRQYLSSAKIRSRIGWSPEYDLKRGLAETIEWYRVNLARQSAGQAEELAEHRV